MQRMTKIFRNNVIILLIIFIAGVLRLWSLSSVPPSPSLDEVSIGYNAYAILKTGRDEYGTFLPLLLRAYDDWRPALYVYFVVPSIAIFGLNAFAVRIPSVLFSLATVYLTYKLVILLFKNDLHVFGRVISVRWLSYTSAMTVAFSPWHIYLSRLGHEVNLGLFVTVFSVYLFFLGVLKRNRVAFCISAVMFGLGFSTYQSEKVVLPILLTTLGILFRLEIVKLGKSVLLAVFLFLLFSVPAAVVTFSPVGLTRFEGTSVFSSSQKFSEDSAINLLHAKEGGNSIGKIYYNRRLVPLRLLVAQYVSHFNPRWLFFGSAREDHKVPHLGLLYAFEAPFLVIGMCLLFFLRLERRIKFFLTLWFFSAPLPASITTGAPHAMRSFTFLPSVEIFVSLGLVFAFFFIKNLKARVVLGAMLTIVFIYAFLQFIFGYFVIFPNTQADSFQSVLSSAMQFVTENDQKYKTVVISNQENLYQSYMFYLFVKKYDPSKYLSEGGTSSGGYAVEHRIGSLQFRPISWQNEEKSNTILYVGNKEDFGTGANILKEFSYPDGKGGVVLVAYD
ncbi:MAG: glycosyltransferase family 39 protein [bacterium]|nr:glycosyltransferase family 39 protein [bacterium]